MSDNSYPSESDSTVEKVLRRLFIIYRNKIDKYIIYPKSRWGFTVFLILYYLKRVLEIGGFYVVSYILGLYILHLSVQFFTPIGLPEADEEDEEDESLRNMKLPETNVDNHEDRGPLIRSMSEFKFWQNATLACLGSIFCTFSQLFDLPVFWPFLLAYFIMLLILTVKR